MKKKTLFMLFLVPCTIIFLFTIFFPVITTFRYSLKYFKLTEPGNERFIGLRNYHSVLTSKEFHGALLNSISILLMVLFIGLVSSMIVALVLNKRTKISSILTAIVIIPWALPPMVNGIMWKFIFFPGYGLLNNLLTHANIIDSPISWTTNRALFLVVIAIIISWRVIPFSAIVILSNLQNIPKEYYESISIDGSNKIQSFFYITLPLIIPSLGIALVSLTTSAINVFDEIIAISGYQYENQTLLVYNYSNTFSFLDFGLGSSISYITMIIAGVFGYFYIRSMKVSR